PSATTRVASSSSPFRRAPASTNKGRTSAAFPSAGHRHQVQGLGYLSPMPSALDHWFATEILVHEEALLRYLRRCWPHQSEIHDLRQEVYVRVYEAAGKALPTQPRAFLFASARHL